MICKGFNFAHLAHGSHSQTIHVVHMIYLSLFWRCCDKPLLPCSLLIFCLGGITADRHTLAIILR